jgi:hypothetical protein
MEHTAFEQLWKAKDEYDLLLGYRVNRSSPLLRRFISVTARLTIYALYGRGVKDVTAPYRLMRIAAFKPLFNALPLDTFAPNSIISGWSMWKKLRIYQIPVEHTVRKSGIMISKWKLFITSAIPFVQAVKFRFFGK